MTLSEYWNPAAKLLHLHRETSNNADLFNSRLKLYFPIILINKVSKQEQRQRSINHYSTTQAYTHSHKQTHMHCIVYYSNQLVRVIFVLLCIVCKMPDKNNNTINQISNNTRKALNALYNLSILYI